VSGATEVDVAVVGAGIVGLAATDALLRRRARVVCLDGGVPGHAQSAGLARGFRHLHDDPALTRLAVTSRASWRRLEQRAGVELLERGGMVRLGGDVEPEIAALRSVGVDARVLDAGEARERLPWLAPEAGPLLFDPDAGAVRAAAAIGALTALCGDAIRRGRVEAIEPAGDGVRLRTSAGDVRCARCLVCAGTGTERLVAPLGIAIDRARRAAFRLTFRVTSPAAGPVPVWGDRSRRFGEGAYGTPEGRDRYAVGLVGATPVLDAPDAEAVPGGAVDVGAARRRLVAYVREAFPGLDPEPVDGMLRLMAAFREPGEDAFGLWARDGVLAFAGHNLFKHAPALGDLLAAAALGEEPDPLLRPPA
jgi:glycine/D-amino acid oxidase-like deaminating enzyme